MHIFKSLNAAMHKHPTVYKRIRDGTHMGYFFTVFLEHSFYHWIAGGLFIIAIVGYILHIEE